jgi:PAS domain S-box-containing protein
MRIEYIVPGCLLVAMVGGVLVEVLRRSRRRWREIESASRQSEQRYRFLAESIPQIVWTARPDGVVNYTNQQFLDYVGATRDEAQRLGWIHFRHPDDRAEATRRWKEANHTGLPYECMYRLRRGCDQSYRWHLARATPMRDESGRIVLWFGTCTDIDDRKRAEDELRASREALSAANRAKDRFLATLSHELRTPLTPVVLALDSMRDDPTLPEPLREDLDMVRRNVGLEARLIDDLLDLTRMTRGTLELRREVVDVHAAVHLAVRSCCTSEIDAKRLSVTLELKAARHHVRADPARIEQVCFNLLSNAQKFTRRGGAIRIASRNEDGQIVLTVTDNGLGIEPHLLPRLFLPFEQGDDTRRFGGLGLGLAVCKTIVELHGGSIQAHSDGPGQGATFTVRLPSAQPVASRPPASSPPLGSSHLRPHRPRLLLVEDHQATADVMYRLLRRLDYDVKVACDLASARRLARQHSFDLLLSDLGLPDGSGLELMRELSREHNLKGIALSGFGMEEDLAQSRAAGFAEHMVKPIRFDALSAAIDRLLEQEAPRHAAAQGAE